MTLYYADNTGPDTNPGTEISPVKTLNKIVLLMAVAGDQGLLKRGVTWAERLNNSRIGTALARMVFGAYGSGALPIIDGTGVANNCVYTARPYVTVGDLDVQNADAGRRNFYIDSGANYFILSRCRGYNGDQQLLTFNITDYLQEFCVFEGSEDTVGSAAFWYNNTQGEINYCIYKGSALFPIRRVAVYGTTGSSLVIRNTIITDYYADGLNISPGSTVNLYNSIICGGFSGSGYAINNAGTVSAYNCLCLPAWASGNLFNGTVTETNPIDAASVIPLPGWRHYRREGIINISVDDYNLDYALSVAAVAEAHGFAISLFTYQTGAVLDADYAAKLQALVHGGAYGLAGGHEVGSHSHSHPRLTNTSAFLITCSDAVAAMTISVTRVGTSDQWTGTLTTTTSGGGAADLNINLASGAYNTINELVAYINSVPGYTCVKNANMSAEAKSVCLAAVAGQSIAGAGYTALVDQPSFFQVEITESKAWIESAVGGGYVCRSFAYPGGITDATVKNAVRDAGYLAGRGDHTPPAPSDALSSMPVYGIHHIQIGEIDGDGGLAATRRLAASWCVSFGQNGLMSCMLSHAADETSIEQWGWIMEVLQQDGIRIMTIGDAAEYIRTSGLWTNGAGDQLYWTRTFSDASDLRLKPGSVLIDRGTAVGLVEDLDGNAVPRGGAVDIGPYEYTRQVLFGGPDGVINSRAVISA